MLLLVKLLLAGITETRTPFIVFARLSVGLDDHELDITC